MPRPPGELATIRSGLKEFPDAPDYELIDPPFGEGAYGKVWLARNAVGQWQALKAVYQANFGENADPYEREFRGINRYNLIFVKGRATLADVGLVTEIPLPGQEGTWVGTAGYMPPEPPGRPEADIYALGMVLYVISTGRDPTFFPELTATLNKTNALAEFVPLNAIILKACDPVASRRYPSAAELQADLDSALARISPPAGLTG